MKCALDLSEPGADLFFANLGRPRVCVETLFQLLIGLLHSSRCIRSQWRRFFVVSWVLLFSRVLLALAPHQVHFSWLKASFNVEERKNGGEDLLAKS